MIVVWGSREDPPAAAVLRLLQERGADVMHLDDAALAEQRYDVALDAGVRGWIEIGGREIDVEAIDGLYLRPGPQPRERAAANAAALLAVATRLDAVVVNRPTAGQSNMSKPFQLAAIAAAGFAVPPTLVTTDPEEARTFLERHERIVYKSISGIRSIVATLDRQAASRLAGVASGPVQLQRWIDGLDVRVHVVGDRWFATAIESTAADYRYAGSGEHELAIAATEIEPALGRRLVELARGMGLLVAGIDLRVTPEGEWFCFEVNPSPGFTFYEQAAGQPMCAAIGNLLLERAKPPVRGRRSRTAAMGSASRRD